MATIAWAMRTLAFAVAVLGSVALPLSCSDEPEGPCLSRPDYSRCGAPLDPTMTYPTYSEALAELMPEACDYSRAFRGSCADGKMIIRSSGEFESSTSYFVGEQFVGGVGSGDVGFCGSPCPFEHFTGTLQSVRCESPQWEPLCPSPEGAPTAPLPGLPSFANGRPGITCESACADLF